MRNRHQEAIQVLLEECEHLDWESICILTDMLKRFRLMREGKLNESGCIRKADTNENCESEGMCNNE